RHVPEGRPHLLTVDDPLVAVAHGSRLHVGEVGAGVRLTEPLAPELSCLEDRGEEALLLLFGSEHHQGGTEQLLAEEADPLGTTAHASPPPRPRRPPTPTPCRPNRRRPAPAPRPCGSRAVRLRPSSRRCRARRTHRRGARRARP